ncbi:TGFBI [Mytilus coruscus]|uniref:TGFBI n=1 Tax=Mytilus coruscus TaxID=42192 RepID=A0A6J8CUF7_MYTCO|nr:TGFBI [Mytilus coruscus]
MLDKVACFTNIQTPYNLSHQLVLDISNNNIWFLPENAFLNNTEIQNLNISYNLLYDIPKAVLSLSNLQLFDIHNNFIQSINETVRKWLEQQNLKYGNKFQLFLKGNRLRCTSDTLEFLEWITKTNISLDKPKRDYRCTLRNGTNMTIPEVMQTKQIFFFSDVVTTKTRRPQPNICTYKDIIKNETSSDEIEITSHHVIRSQVCDDKGSSYKCTNSLVVGGKEETIVEIKECCPGFTRKINQIGCPTAVETKNLLDKAKELKLTKFIEAMKMAGLEQDIKNGNITIFAPVDKSFDQMSDLLASKSQITLQLMTANCIKVKSRDAVATNGVINVVEEVLEPVSETLMEIISSDPEMSYMKTAIGKSDLGKMFRDEGQLTLFAPSNSAFRKLDPILLSRILDGDTECLIKLLQNHILPNVICSHAIQGRSKSKNMLNHMLNLTRAADNKLFVNGAQSVDTDVMATNGVLYVIDDVLVPDEALDVLEIARRSGASAIVKLIEDTGLAKTLQTTQNLTLFAPSDAAIGNLEKVPTDPTELMKVLTFHVVPSEEHTCRLYNDQQLDTLNSGKQIRFNEYTTPFPFA